LKRQGAALVLRTLMPVRLPFENAPAGFLLSGRSYRWSKAVGILGTGHEPVRE
jgi:hypothetical protein